MCTFWNFPDGEEDWVSTAVTHVEERDQAAAGPVRVLDPRTKFVQHVPARTELWLTHRFICVRNKRNFIAHRQVRAVRSLYLPTAYTLKRAIPKRQKPRESYYEGCWYSTRRAVSPPPRQRWQSCRSGCSATSPPSAGPQQPCWGSPPHPTFTKHNLKLRYHSKNICITERQNEWVLRIQI